MSVSEGFASQRRQDEHTISGALDKEFPGYRSWYLLNSFRDVLFRPLYRYQSFQLIPEGPFGSSDARARTNPRRCIVLSCSPETPPLLSPGKFDKWKKSQALIV